jgi:hypothetical protein
MSHFTKRTREAMSGGRTGAGAGAPASRHRRTPTRRHRAGRPAGAGRNGRARRDVPAVNGQRATGRNLANRCRESSTHDQLFLPLRPGARLTRETALTRRPWVCGMRKAMSDGSIHRSQALARSAAKSSGRSASCIASLRNAHSPRSVLQWGGVAQHRSASNRRQTQCSRPRMTCRKQFARR